MCLLVQMYTQFCQYKSRHSVIWGVIWWSYLVKLRLYTNLHATHCTNSQYQSFKFLLPGISNDFLFISAMSLCMDSSYLLKFWSLFFYLNPVDIVTLQLIFIIPISGDLMNVFDICYFSFPILLFSSISLH